MSHGTRTVRPVVLDMARPSGRAMAPESVSGDGCEWFVAGEDGADVGGAEGGHLIAAAGVSRADVRRHGDVVELLESVVAGKQNSAGARAEHAKG